MTKSFFRSHLRPLLPFPKRRTWLRWFPPYETRNIVHLMALHGVDGVIDVGGNQGQFIQKLRSAGFRGPALSFEPLSSAHKTLESKAAKDSNWRIAPRMAIGDREGTLEINIYEDTSLSSTYKIIGSSEEPEVERSPMRRLDDALEESGFDCRKPLLKIDVQGFEDKVLDGAPETLKRAEALFLEVSLQPMYEQDTPYLEMLERLRELGFHAVFFTPVLNRKKLGEAIQLDAFLVRNPKGL